MDIQNIAKKMSSNMNQRLIYDIEKRFNDEIENVHYYIMEGYDWLSMLVSDPNSKTNPYIYRDKFEEKIKTFKYIEKTSKSVNFRTPDLDNFDFHELPIVEQILHGTSGIYAEISQEDMEKMTGTTVINNKPVDPSVSKKDRIYLERYTNAIRAKEKNILKKKLVVFPFSNTPPLSDKVFGPADEYVRANINSWVKEASSHSQEIIMNGYKGVS